MGIKTIGTEADDLAALREVSSLANMDLEAMALLEILNLGKKEFQDGKFQSADKFFEEMDAEK